MGNIWMRAFARGIAVHHEGMPGAYRELVEVCFRSGHIKIVVSTETLGLGVNMPCRCVAFAGDSHHLTPLIYQQCSGRAGRRGHDYEGQVVFYGIPPRKFSSLILSGLPNLSPKCYLNASTSLRILALYNSFGMNGENTKEKIDFIQEMLLNLMTKPYFSVEERTKKESELKSNMPSQEETNDQPHKEGKILQMQYLFRYSLDYLIKHNLADNHAKPIGLAGLVCKLHGFQNGIFIFVELFKHGIIHRICRQWKSDKLERCEEISRELLSLLCHLFECVPLTEDFLDRSEIKSSPSKVILEDLTSEVRHVIQTVNQKSINTLVHCLQKILSTDQKGKMCIPMTSTLITSDSQLLQKDDCKKDNADILIEDIRSFTVPSDSWSRLSPMFPCMIHRNNLNGIFSSIQELLQTIHCPSNTDKDLDLFFTLFQSGAINPLPFLPITNIKGNIRKLNAYALDFFKHGQLQTIINFNGLSRLDVWPHLQKMGTILSDIHISLKQLHLNSTPGGKAIVESFAYLSEHFNQKLENAKK